MGLGVLAAVLREVPARRVPMGSGCDYALHISDRGHVSFTDRPIVERLLAAHPHHRVSVDPVRAWECRNGFLPLRFADGEHAGECRHRERQADQQQHGTRVPKIREHAEHNRSRTSAA